MRVASIRACVGLIVAGVVFVAWQATPAHAAPTLTLMASPTSVTPGGTVTLSWTTTGAQRCWASGGAWLGPKTIPTGTQPLRNLQTTSTYTLTCYDQAGARVTRSVTVTVTATTVDTTPPSIPTNLTAVATSCSAVALTWSPSTDTGGSGLKGYNVYKSGTFLKHVAAPTTTTTDTGLSGATAYRYAISAVDTAGNESARSPEVSVTLPACSDTTPPSGTVVINGGAATTASRSVTLSLSATDDRGDVSQMQFANDGTTYSSPEPYATTKAWTLSAGDGLKTVSAKFKDAAGNWSTPASDTITLTLPPPQYRLAITKAGAGSGTVTSSPAGISCGADCAEDYPTGSRVTLTATAASGSILAGWSGACTGTSSSCTLTMNADQAATVTFAPAPDTTPPSIPTNLTAVATGCSAVALTWSPSTDTGGSGLKGYNVYKSGTFLKHVAAPTTTTTDTGLTAATTYRYAVSALDSAGNESVRSPEVSVTLPACPEAPRIVTQPASQTVLLGQRAVFRITATGIPAPTYQWTRNGVEISGATNAVHRIKQTTLADNGAAFRCRVSNSAGSVTSDPASLTVNRYNFVVILTDDQRWDTLTMTIGDRQVMPHTNALLVSQGVNFTNAFVTDPLCCPDRASLLSGGFYPHHTGVLSNGPPNGGAPKFNDRVTLATLLQEAGYRTALIGKYLNQYNKLLPRSDAGFTMYIPPRWTTFIGKENTMNWFNFTVTIGTSGQTSAVGRNEAHTQYVTDYLRDQAAAFIDQSGRTPFFLYFAPEAPHGPATPAPEDATLFSDYVYRGRGYDQTALTEDPDWVAEVDRFNRSQLRSLQAVDRAVKTLVEQVQAAGVADRTVFIFTSDNGFLWGEHRLTAKWKPNEESIRVPFVVVMPGIAPRSDDHLVVSNLDIGPTLFALTDIDKQTDGRNLVPLLKDAATPWREDLLIEDLYGGWAGLRTKEGAEEWKYVERFSGAKELYNLVTDPYELTNLAAATPVAPSHQTLMTRFADRLRPLKGLAILSGPTPPQGKVGTAYTFQLSAWGGNPPYTWSVLTGSLPAGLSLNPTTGLISGTPTTAQEAAFSIQVQDQTDPAVTQIGKPQTIIRNHTILIEPTALE